MITTGPPSPEDREEWESLFRAHTSYGRTSRPVVGRVPGRRAPVRAVNEGFIQYRPPL
ncbi:hypothetical protein [Umezawaea sp. NPDC059074]|uniref:hypothetical protein n=1 Tax=Umezawaea sp. NPDC059074 TaxID=3346716 RepID=UPI0036769B89